MVFTCCMVLLGVAVLTVGFLTTGQNTQSSHVMKQGASSVSQAQQQNMTSANQEIPTPEEQLGLVQTDVRNALGKNLLTSMLLAENHFLVVFQSQQAQSQKVDDDIVIPADGCEQFFINPDLQDQETFQRVNYQQKKPLPWYVTDEQVLQPVKVEQLRILDQADTKQPKNMIQLRGSNAFRIARDPELKLKLDLDLGNNNNDL